MLNRAVQVALRRPIAVSVCFGGAAVLGLFSALRLPLDIYPSLDYPMLRIETSCHGLSSRAIEEEITSVIEGELASLRGIVKMQSLSREGHSRIDLHLQRNANSDFIMCDINERLSFLRKHLPNAARPSTITRHLPLGAQESAFLSYYLTGPITGEQLRTLALKRVKRTLEGVPGVAGVEVRGGREKQLMITCNHDALSKWRIHPMQIVAALRSADVMMTIGSLAEGNQLYAVTVNEKPASLEDINNLPLAYHGPRCIQLGDVAKISEALSPMHEIERINDQPAVFINIMREYNTNAVTVANRIQSAVARLESELPSGVHFIKDSDQSSFIMDNIRALAERIAISLCIICGVLILFIRRARYTIAILASVATSLLFTVFLIFLLRYSFNIVTLTGLTLVLGMLVDNAIVVTENIVRQWEEGSELYEGALLGTTSIARPLVAATLTSVAALLPFLYLAEDLKIYFLPFSITASCALIASIAAALFFTPMLATRMHAYRDGSPVAFPRRHSRLLNIIPPLQSAYGALLRTTLNHKRFVVIASVLVIGLPIWLMPSRLNYSGKEPAIERAFRRTYNTAFDSKAWRRLKPYVDHIFGGGTHLFFRYVERREMWIYREQDYLSCWLLLPFGTPIETADGLAKQLEDAIRGTKGIARIKTSVQSEVVRIMVLFDPQYMNTRAPFIAREALISRGSWMGNARTLITGFGLPYAGGEILPLSATELTLTGYDYSELEEICEDIKCRLGRNPRVSNIRTNQSRGYRSSDLFEHSIRLDPLLLGNRGLTGRDVMMHLHPFISPYLYRQRIRLGDVEIPFTMSSSRYDRSSLFDLLHYQLANKSNQFTALHSIASLQRTPIASAIERENQEYYRIIAFDYLGSFKAAQKFSADFIVAISLPAGFALREGRNHLWRKGEERNIALVLLLAIALIYMVLAGLYESLIYPLLVLCVVPFSLIGAFIAYLITGKTFSQAAYIGTILMAGIVVNNAIFLLDRINELRKSGMNERPIEIMLIRAGQDRLRPILMTSLTTLAGLLPFIALSRTEGIGDIWQNLALSTFGGLIFGTIFVLLVLPVFVRLADRRTATPHRAPAADTETVA